MTASRFTVIDAPSVTTVIDAFGMGPPGHDGHNAGGGGGVVFVLDVTPTAGGVVGMYEHPSTIPSDKVVSSCVSDTSAVRVHVGLEGGADNYSPTCTVAGIPATLTETSTARWFTGYADITINAGLNDIEVVSSTGAETSVAVTLAGRGPNILGSVLGAYPGMQSALKAGDTIHLSVTTEPEAVEVKVFAAGASAAVGTFPVVGGVADCVITAGASSNNAPVYLRARNLLGTYGDSYSSAPVSMDQTYPSFSPIVVGYPNGQQALREGEQATVSCTVSSFDTVQYTATGISVPSPSQYLPLKVVTSTSADYVASGTNYSISARRAANGAISSTSVLVATVASPMTASISIAPAGKLVGSPIGVDYTVIITPSQIAPTAPELNASLGSWVGNWYKSGSTWHRILRIADTTPKGVGVFSSLSIYGLSGIEGTVISAGSTYVVGGFTSRVVTFPAFSRVAPLGTTVYAPSSMSCQILGGNVLSLYGDNVVRENGFYPANSDGTYNAAGQYLGLSDSVFAGANTSGTLQATVQEAA